jgi:hypothetical protein
MKNLIILSLPYKDKEIIVQPLRIGILMPQRLVELGKRFVDGLGKTEENKDFSAIRGRSSGYLY